MANTILTTEIIAGEALDTLRNNAVMANLVHRDFEKDFVAGVGDTISIRKPATFVAKEFTDTIETQDATEEKVEVKLDKLLDVSFKVTAKELTMGIEDFSAQFLQPAMQAFADKIDGYLLGLASQVTNRIEVTGAVTQANIVDARKFLTKGAAPLTDRRFVYSPEVEADLLKSDWFVAADKTGDVTALKEASLGRVLGLDFYVDQNTKADGANGVPSIVFHKNAFALVTRQLATPQGAANASVANYEGFGIRVVSGYDITHKTDTISLDLLCGVKVLNPALAAVIADKRA